MLLTLWICALLYNVAEAGSTCFCSATGDPHIRDFSGSTSNVGAGAFTLAKDGNGKFSVDLVVTQTSATLTQIAEVNVKLAGDQPEEMPGYGMIHKADGIEIRVLSNNNVFIIWDASKITGVSGDTLCGGTCPDAEEDAAIQAKIEEVEKEYSLQHNQVANLILDQVSTEIQIDEIIRRLAELKQQGAQTDALIAAMEEIVNAVRRRRRRRSVDDRAETEEVIEKIVKEMIATGHKAEEETNSAIDILADDTYGFNNNISKSDGGAGWNETVKDVGQNVENTLKEVNAEKKYQATEIEGLLKSNKKNHDNVDGMLDDTGDLLKKEYKMQKNLKGLAKTLSENQERVFECMDREDRGLPSCLREFHKRDL